MTLIDRYLIRTVLTYTALVMAALLVLGGLFTFIDQQDDSDVGRYGTGDALVFTLLSIPQQAYELMPIGALLGALLGMGMLAGNSELTAIRASGMSVVRIATAIALGGMTITLLTVALGEFIAPTLQNIAYQQKALRKFSHVSLLGAGGAWIKEGNTIINVDERSGAEWYGGINIFRLKSPGELASMAIAERAFAEKRSWHLDHYSETRFGGNQISSEHVASTNLHMLVDSGILGGGAKLPQAVAVESIVATHPLF